MSAVARQLDTGPPVLRILEGYGHGWSSYPATFNQVIGALRNRGIDPRGPIPPCIRQEILLRVGRTNTTLNHVLHDYRMGRRPESDALRETVATRRRARKLEQELANIKTLFHRWAFADGHMGQLSEDGETLDPILIEAESTEQQRWLEFYDALFEWELFEKAGTEYVAGRVSDE